MTRAGPARARVQVRRKGASVLDTSGVDFERLYASRSTRDNELAWRAARPELQSTRLPPTQWRIVHEGKDGRAWVSVRNGEASVIESVSRERDERLWLHVSLARRDRLPTWDELRDVKQQFLGSHVEAYVVLPPISRYVNVLSTCLHLWTCLDAPRGVLPDFSGGTGSI
jgi:hypothetical protein